MKRLFILILNFTPLLATAQKQYPADVEAVLQQTKSNRGELEKALQYFYNTKDDSYLGADLNLASDNVKERAISHKMQISSQGA